MVEIQIALIFLTVVFGLLHQIEGHRHDWGTTQFIWHKMNVPHSILEIPMQTEFLIYDLKTYREVRDFKDQYHNVTFLNQVFDNTRTGTINKTSIELRPRIEITINDPISENDSSYLDLQSKITNVTSLNTVRKL
jgi:hypothetical protein